MVNRLNNTRGRQRFSSTPQATIWKSWKKRRTTTRLLIKFSNSFFSLFLHSRTLFSVLNNSLQSNFWLYLFTTRSMFNGRRKRKTQNHFILFIYTKSKIFKFNEKKVIISGIRHSKYFIACLLNSLKIIILDFFTSRYKGLSWCRAGGIKLKKIESRIWVI